ncbi:MAG: Thymidylate kinase [Acidimicrobiales bacterium]|nr:MAG: dTMP kinase [Actinomycetota bacterium]MBV6508441.1 Thymidylate kinase [Acidimicrobiales bacterium]RIK04752.1 MAG: dTMP kinase [Acidobacteriota bacterium]
MTRHARGRFIALEGGEACGKTTQADLLAARLGALRTHQPGGTGIGIRIRHLVLDPTSAGLDPRAEALLMAADRAQHVSEIIRPALEGGRDVVTDRYAGSTLAYQGYGRGLPIDEIRRISDWASRGLWPDLVIFLDVSLEVAARRFSDDRDRMEAAGDEFHQRVLAGFRALAAEDAGWVVIDGSGSVEDVGDQVYAAVRERLGDTGSIKGVDR